MPWDDRPQAGFTTGKPWLPLSPDWQHTNVAWEQKNRGSMLSLYKQLIRLKKTSRALTSGIYQPVEVEGHDCLAYQRVFQSDGQTEAMLIALNFGARERAFSLPETASTRTRTGTLILSTHPRRGEETWTADRFTLGPDEGIIVRLESHAYASSLLK